MSSKISIITICFNSESTIRKTINSVINQTYENIEYIIVDGGSTDSTPKIINEYREFIDYFISEPDKGIYDAMNKGIKISTGQWIHLLNSDDYYFNEDTLKNAVPLLSHSHTNYFMMWRELDNNKRILQNWKYNRLLLFFTALLPHPALIVSRDQYQNIGFYDINYQIAADHDMILRLTAKWPGVKHSVALTVMKQGGVSTTNLHKSLTEFSQVINKNGIPIFIVKIIEIIKKIWWGINNNERTR